MTREGRPGGLPSLVAVALSQSSNLVVERSYGSFQRSLRLPSVVKPDEVKAQFRDGVLTIALPKAGEQNRSHRIRIAGGSAARAEAGGGGDSSAGKSADKATTQSPKQ